MLWRRYGLEALADVRGADLRGADLSHADLIRRTDLPASYPLDRYDFGGHCRLLIRNAYGQVGLPLPRSLTGVAKWIARYRYGVDWSSLDYLKGAARIHAPILLLQGTADQTVPAATSDELARTARDVTYVRVRGADHLDSWNLDPARYDAAVQAFVGRALGSAAA